MEDCDLGGEYMKQSENGIAQSVGEGEKIQGMRNLNICNFSNILYSSYKENERKINDFDKFMDDLIKEGKTNKKDVCEFIESKLTNYFNLNTVRFNIDQYIEEKELYTKKLRIILQKQKVDDDISDEQINGIILKYLKLKFNLTLIPKFKKSNAEFLFYYFEKIIDSSKKEFEKRIRQEAIHLAKILFEEFLELKHKIENTEIKADESKYSTEVQNETIKKIEDYYKKYKREIENCISKSKINSEIEKLKEKANNSKFEDEMEKTVKKVNEVVDSLQLDTTSKREEFQNSIKQSIENLKKDLNLFSLDLVKESYSYCDYSYYSKSDNFFTKLITPWGTIKNFIHDYQGDRRSACNKYEKKMEEKIQDLKESINKDLLKKKESCIEDINKMFQSCNDKLSGLKNNKNEFDSLFKELKENLKKSFAQE